MSHDDSTRKRPPLAAAAVVVLAFVLTAAWAQPVWAWGDLGHKVVCEIAFQGLNQKAKREVIRLIRTDPEFRTFADSCTWADHPSQRAGEHFINAPRTLSRFTDARCPMASTCLFTAITGDLQVLRTPKNDAAKLASLKFLGHWIGDLHQPLHVSFQDDRGGNSIGGNSTGGNSTGGDACSGSLHAVWDICIPERGIGADPRTVAQALLAEITPGQRASWTTTPVVGWANESFLIARTASVQYCTRVGAACIYAPGHEQFVKGETERVVTVDADYITMHTPLVAARLKQGGVRLAHLLNTTLGR